MSLDREAVVRHALELPGTILGSCYGQPAVKADGPPVVMAGRW